MACRAGIPEFAGGTLMAFVPYDDVIRHGCVYLKYFNGQFFLNAEMAYWDETINLIGVAPMYNQSWRYVLETGALMGSGKVSVLYAFMPGADRRHGALIDKQPFVQNAQNAAFVIFQPYTYLLGYGGRKRFRLGQTRSSAKPG